MPSTPTLSERGDVVRALQARFNRNLEAFRIALPEAFHRFVGHTPRSVSLGWVEGEPGLRTREGNPLHGPGLRALASAQARHAVENPAYLTTHSEKTPILGGETLAHFRTLDGAIERLNAHPRTEPARLPGTVPFLGVFGTGLGYGLEALLDAVEVQHLLVVEPLEDVFHASLHTFDWAALMKRQSATGRTLELVVGGETADQVREIQAYVDAIGPFHLAQPYLFQQGNSAEIRRVLEAFRDEVLPRALGFQGFFDDERMGLAHTLRNVASGIPALLRTPAPRTPSEALPPVLIVGNGPSLDGALDDIRRLRDRALVISCGTAFGSLSRAGIRPDLHLEIERSREICEWLSEGTRAEDREAVRMLGLNTVHPRVFGLFPHRGMVLKANDTGARLLARLAGEELHQAAHVNPNVANFAVALVGALGFPRAYLLGIDLGFPRGDLHHSTLSAHYRVRPEEEGSVEIHRAEKDRTVEVPGNLGGTVRTLDVFLASARSMRAAMAAAPSTRYLNAGEGIRIDGAEPVRAGEIELTGPRIDGQAVLDAVLNPLLEDPRRVDPDPDEREGIRVGTLALIQEIQDLIRGPVGTVAQGMTRLFALHLTLEERSRTPGGAAPVDLLRGSVARFSLVLAQALHRTPNEPEAVALFEAVAQDFEAFLEAARAEVEHGLFAEDQRVRGLRDKLEAIPS